jgi:hypothetical protein
LSEEHILTESKHQRGERTAFFKNSDYEDIVFGFGGEYWPDFDFGHEPVYDVTHPTWKTDLLNHLINKVGVHANLGIQEEEVISFLYRAIKGDDEVVEWSRPQ